MTDNINNLLRDLALKDSGMHRHENPETGAVVLYPDVPAYPQGSKAQRRIEDQWEQRALDMHATQKAITVAPKPRENTYARRVVRAD